jgi:hypothetical protein
VVDSFTPKDQQTLFKPEAVNGIVIDFGAAPDRSRALAALLGSHASLPRISRRM